MTLTQLCYVCLAVLLGSISLSRVDGAPQSERLGEYLETEEVSSEEFDK